jgi:predicted protein tyrosine phosphatase
MTKTIDIFECNAPWDNRSQGTDKRVLFVCSAGMLRSPTAAVIGASMGLNTRSCGSYKHALIPITGNLIKWAEVIVFMDQENYTETQRTFYGDELILDLARKSKIWNISDTYNYMDSALQYTLRYYMEELL